MPFLDGSFLIVERAANGWIVKPPLRGDYQNPKEQHVFRSAEDLAEWVRQWANSQDPESTKT